MALGRSSVVGLDPETGRRRWAVPRAAGPSVPPAIDRSSRGGLAVFTQGTTPRDAGVGAVSLHSGRRLWTLRLTQPATGGPTVSGDTVFVGTIGGLVYAIDASSGRVAWRRAVSGEVAGAPAVSEGRVVVVAEDTAGAKATVQALDQRNGRPVWSFASSLTSLRASTPTIAGGVVYVGLGDLTVRALRLATGAVVWTHRVRSVFSPFVSPQCLLLSALVLRR